MVEKEHNKAEGYGLFVALHTLYLKQPAAPVGLWGIEITF
jgi:hypothetical protein